jgi:aerobic carbon-monoxide dehydrogenase small subunit
MIIILTVNRKTHRLELHGQETLLEVLRDQLGLTGTKTACDEGECGACTVLVNNRSVLSCLTLACDIDGEEVTTIEGLAQEENLHPLQQAFLDKGAVQCGFCIPGMIMASKSLLDQNPNPTAEEIETALDGNICRCSGYIKIIEAVQYAGELLKKQKRSSPTPDA